MAWVKIPKENHTLFYARLPRDKRIQTLQMFGAAAAKVNGHLFGGLFAKSFMVKLGDSDHATALALDGAEKFDPMGNGRVMSNSVLMPESLMDEPDEMTAWLQKALDYAVTLPPKKAKPAAKKASKTTPAKAEKTAKANTKKPATKKPAATKKAPATKPAATNKAPATKSAATKSAATNKAPATKPAATKKAPATEKAPATKPAATKSAATKKAPAKRTGKR